MTELAFRERAAAGEPAGLLVLHHGRGADEAELLAEFHDELWARTGTTPERTVLGGFSMGSVMSYSLGLAAGRPAPAGILAFSGFVPVVERWEPSTGDRPALRAF